MQILNLIREKLGISQEGLAGWLNVSRAFMRKAADNDKTLGIDALGRLNILYNCWKQVEQEGPAQLLGAMPERDEQECNLSRLKDCQCLLAVNQRRLANMKVQHLACAKLNAVLLRLKEMECTHELWIADQQVKLAQRFASCNKAAQAPVEKLVFLLIAEIGYLASRSEESAGRVVQEVQDVQVVGKSFQ